MGKRIWDHDPDPANKAGKILEQDAVDEAAYRAAEQILDVGNDPDFTAKYKDGYEAGFKAGVEWARKKPISRVEEKA